MDVQRAVKKRSPDERLAEHALRNWGLCNEYGTSIFVYVKVKVNFFCQEDSFIDNFIHIDLIPT